MARGSTSECAEGDRLLIRDLPVDRVRYFGAFVDDNDSYDTFGAPDSGDPVCASEPLSPVAGQRLSVDVYFTARSP